MTLTEMGQRLLELRAIKDALEAQTKENNAAIEALKKEMAQQMVDDDTPKFVHAGHSFSLLPKTSYTKKGDAELAESGLDYDDYFSAPPGRGAGRHHQGNGERQNPPVRHNRLCGGTRRTVRGTGGGDPHL